MNKLVALLIGLLLVCLKAEAQYDPEALAILEAMSAKYKKVASFNAVFTQKLTNKNAGLNEEISGKIGVKDNMFVLDIAGQKIFNDGENIYTYNEEIQEVTISSNVEEDAEITLSNIYDLYKEGFKYALISQLPNGDRIVEMDPESRDKSFFKIKMAITAADDLRSFTVFERSGNTYLYSIDSFEEVDLADSDFTFNSKDYPGVEVIDFR